MTTLEILAAIDAIFYPCRSAEPRIRQVIHEARVAFHRMGGVPIVAGGSSTDRKQAGRKLDALEDCGKVEVTRSAGRIVAAKLTSDTERDLRRKVGPLTPTNAMPLLHTVASTLRAYGRDFLGTRWCRETDLAGCSYDDPDAGRLLSTWEEELLPLLIRGLVVSNTDAERRAWYSITDAGRAALKTAPNVDIHFNTPVRKERAEYIRLMKRARRRLEAGTPADPREIGPTPLPTTL